MEDNKIIELFFRRDQRAIQEVDAKYGRLCYTLANNILNDRSDAEECVNDAYLGAWNAIPPEKPNPLRAYLCRIVRNLSLKRYYANTAAKRRCECTTVLEELEDVLASPNNVECYIETNLLIQIIRDFLNALPEENRVIFLRRYWFLEPYASIAQCVGLSEKNVSVRLTRIRKQLKEYLAEREVFV